MKKIIVFTIAMGFALTGFAQKADSTKTVTIRVRGNAISNAGQPLIIINGNKQYFRDISMLKEMDTENIESITVLKDSTAISLYGAEAFAGVIDIKTKDSKVSSNHLISTSSITPNLNGKVLGFAIRPNVQSDETLYSPNFSVTKNGIKTKNGTATPLYIIDGEEVTDSKNIDPGTIESIVILKDGTAQQLYGDKANNGVIIIKTKNAKPLPKKN